MSLHLHREMEKLNRLALEMCSHVEQNVRDAARAFLERDPELAARVVAADRHVDLLEVELAEDCLKTLALHQPVAGDLRFIFSLSKISGILERTGDLAENLARKGRALSRLEPVAMPPELAEMAEEARVMLRDATDSLVDREADKARAVIDADEDVDRKKRVVRRRAEAAILANPQTCAQWFIIVSASRNLERIADMAANIAAEVVYLVDGRVVRHGFDCEDAAAGAGPGPGAPEV